MNKNNKRKYKKKKQIIMKNYKKFKISDLTIKMKKMKKLQIKI